MLSNEELAKTQLEISYLAAKLRVLVGVDLAPKVLADWINTTVEETEQLVRHCSGVRLPTHTAVYLYQQLGFTYVEIGKFVGKSTPSIVQYLKQKHPVVLTGSEKTPYDDETWQRLRDSLDTKRKELLLFGFRAKESVF